MRELTSRRPKIVVIGGGTGLPVILRNLRDQNVDITAVVTVADDGGSSGIIRHYVNVVPPGDIRNVMVALAEIPDIYKELFQYRFETTDDFFAGHAIGNLIIAALSEMKGGIFDAVQELSQLMRVNGHIYPAANEPLELHAQFADGSTLSGESEITAAHKLIKRVWVETSNHHQQPQAVQPVIDAIMNADQIVLGPGSLFTSILPNLMIDSVGQAVKDSAAEVVYICNIMTQKGETESFSDADHVRVLNHHWMRTLLIRCWLTRVKCQISTLTISGGMKCPNRYGMIFKGYVIRDVGSSQPTSCNYVIMGPFTTGKRSCVNS